VGVRRGFLSPASLVTPKARSPLSAPASVSTVGDLRGLAASGLDSLKRRLDALHADNARDLEASHSRISKRIKMQTQSCVQMAEEAEKEHKKMIDNYSQQADEIKVLSVFDPCLILNFVWIWSLKLRSYCPCGFLAGIVQEVDDRGAVVFVSCVQGDPP
uniref:Uncharacterized protein n=1 Tax=Aegilops tauschii subsp. strangulata TaxID=200361 RepID=A0A453TBU1_AEGTS